MTSNQPEGTEDQTLLAFAAQRGAALSIVEGWTRRRGTVGLRLVGLTWTGLVEHLGGAERHWFQGVVTGAVLSHRLQMRICRPRPEGSVRH